MGRAKMPREVQVRISSLGDDGFGRGAVGERQVRIKNALTDEAVTARVLKRRKGEWLAEAFEIDGPPSGDRQMPACGYFPRCGGCAVQHLNYPAQLALKEEGLRQALAAESVAADSFEQPVHGPRFNYRTKARFGVRVVGGEVLLGFRESFSNRVGRMSACLTLVEPLSDLLVPLKHLISGLSAPERIPQVEIAAGDGEETAFILRHLEALTEVDRHAIAEFSTLQRTRAYTQSGGYETVVPASARAETPYLGYRNPDFGLHFLFAPMDFTQVNLAMNRKLVQAAVLGLGAPAGARVLDLFCGIGNFTLPLAASGLEVCGLEASPAAIERARMNALHNGLAARCEFAVQDLYDADCPIPGRADYLILDPPRSGAGPNLPVWLEATGATRIAYVSCSPGSFAKDARIIVSAGFSLEQVGIYDMFPNTAHVETLGIFQKSW